MKSGMVQVSAPTDIRTRLGEGTEINGEVRFTEVLKVDAKVSGRVISDGGSLVVSEQGHVNAEIEAGFVEVLGTVEGKITAKYKVEIRPGGRVYGDIFTPVLNIEHGAIFDGKCHMIDESRNGQLESALKY
ncbi:MAG TPA: polymer-forming cytoskeletal protein [Blastocatellia bacterium]|nr:polymer-forming cytoskeletal protein [Blastocatellia bacterium]